MRDVPKAQILKRIEFENPWWDRPHEVPSNYTQWKPRPYLELFYPLVENQNIRRAVLLMGPRRVGKTVLIHHAISRLLQTIPPKQIVYFSIDHPLYNSLGLEQLLEFFGKVSGTDYKTTPTYVFFDEIQYLKDWEIHLKTLMDAFPAVKPITSGSAAVALRLKSVESGAGRFTEFLLPPLTFHEYLTLLDSSDKPMPKLMHPKLSKGPNFSRAQDIKHLNQVFVDYLNYGGYPEVVFSADIQKDPGRFVKADIVDKVLLRDLPSLYGIQDIQELNSLFTTLAFNTANEVSLEDLTQNSGVAKNTIKRYIEYLEAAFLIRVLHRVDQSGRRFRRANFFKVYLTNPSIYCALFAPVKSHDESMGSLVETAIFSQWFHADMSRFHYSRWPGGEVDMVFRGPEQTIQWAMEAMWSNRLSEDSHKLKSSLRFCRLNDLRDMFVTSKQEKASKVIDGVNFEFVPASEYCYTVGYNLVMGKKAFRPEQNPS